MSFSKSVCGVGFVQRRWRAAVCSGGVGIHRLRLEALESRTLLTSDRRPERRPVLRSPDLQWLNGCRTRFVSFRRGATDDPARRLLGPGGLRYVPAQFRAAYGVTSISLGGVSGDGAGQTIAVIDAYNDPAFVDSTDPGFATSDLHKFDVQCGLPDPPSFRKLNQNGGTTLPPNDTEGWAVEEALDIEWAHAMAPMANIIAIEANSGEYSSQSSRIWRRRSTPPGNLPGVSVISMSYGWDESFVNSMVGPGAEVAQNPLYTTPAGHTGVTFLASTGDSGSPGGYPAYSPNVVAVGGTTLTLSGNTYVSETGWSGSGGGGQSIYESEPSYQIGVQSSGCRADSGRVLRRRPSTGVAVYDSYEYGGWPGYIGGTSVSSPCWAGLIAIGDQLRVAEGLAPMDGPSQTLPMLYGMKAGDFHDITSGNNGYSAGAGYDMVTGIGSPVANNLVPDFVVLPRGHGRLLGAHVPDRRVRRHYGSRQQRLDVLGDRDLPAPATASRSR